MTTTDSWDDILDPGETILWQGAPDERIVWSDMMSPETAMGGFFFVFASVWTAGSVWAMSQVQGGAAVLGLFPVIGIVFMLVGLYLLVGRLFWRRQVRRGTYYTLTDRAAYIATRTLGRRKLERYGFDEMGDFRLDVGTPGSVWFGERVEVHHGARSRTGRGHRRLGNTRTVRTRIGFDRIARPRDVYRLVRDAHEAATGERNA